MLDILRKKSSTFAIYFVFAILIVIFAVGFGAVAPDQACGGSAPGAFKNVDFVEVDGETIDALLVRTGMQLTGDAASPKTGFTDPDDRFRYQTRFAFMNLYGPFSGGIYGTDPQQQSPIKLTKVVDELIETKLVSKYARQLGLGVSKAELNQGLALLLSNEGFRDPKTGALEVNNYRNWVGRSLETTVSGFEKLVEEELLRERVIQLLVGEIGVGDQEIEQAYKLENDKVTIDYIAIDERAAAPLVPVTDAEVAEWLGKNEEKVKAEYENDKPRKYTTPKQWTLRGIKVEAPDPASVDDEEQKKGLEEERKAAKAKAEKLLADMKTAFADKKVPEVPEGEPKPAFDPVTVFGAVAMTSSDDASKAEGGKLAPQSLDALGSGPFGPAVKTAAEAMKPGELTELLEVPSGFWMFLPESISEEKVEAYDAVKNAIAKSSLQLEKAGPFHKTLADEVLAEAKKDPTKKMADVAKALNEKYGIVSPSAAVLGAEKGLEPGLTTFARLSRLAAGYPASSPYLFELGGKAPDLVNAAFTANEQKPLLDKVFTVGGGGEGAGGKLIIARFATLVPAEAIKDEDKTELRQQLTIERRRIVYRGWYEDLLAKTRASGDLEFTRAFEEERKAAEQAFVEQGGAIPGVTPAP